MYVHADGRVGILAGGERVLQLSAGVAALRKLERLDISTNRVAKLCPGLERCTALTALDLSSNRLRSYPAAVYKLTCVRYAT